jgi:hypothetical protein
VSFNKVEMGIPQKEVEKDWKKFFIEEEFKPN